MTTPDFSGARISTFSVPVYGCHKTSGDCVNVLGLHRDQKNRGWYVTSDDRLVPASEWNLHQLPAAPIGAS